MWVCFHAVAFLVPLIGGVEHGAATTSTSYSSITTWPQRHLEDNLLHVVDEVDAGPDPFFEDLDQRLPHANEKSEIDEVADNRTLRKRTYIVEVYENESRGIVRRLANSLPIRRWTYKVSASVVYFISATYHGGLSARPIHTMQNELVGIRTDNGFFLNSNSVVGPFL